MIQFFVPGTPVPKGSAKAFVNKRTGRAQVLQDNREKQRPWASLVSFQAQQVVSAVTVGPVRLTLHFTLQRPKSHFGSGKNTAIVKASAPYLHVSKPDLDKLVRCVKDALTGVVYHDDSQVCSLVTGKVYGDRTGVLVKVEAL